MTATLSNEQKLPISVTPLTALGNTAKVDGAPLWSSSNINVCTLVIAPDGMSAVVNGVGPGTSTITVTADADLTSAVSQISSSIVVTVSAALATTLQFTVGAPS